MPYWIKAFAKWKVQTNHVCGHQISKYPTNLKQHLQKAHRAEYEVVVKKDEEKATSQGQWGWVDYKGYKDEEKATSQGQWGWVDYKGYKVPDKSKQAITECQ